MNPRLRRMLFRAVFALTGVLIAMSTALPIHAMRVRRMAPDSMLTVVFWGEVLGLGIAGLLLGTRIAKQTESKSQAHVLAVLTLSVAACLFALVLFFWLSELAGGALRLDVQAK